MKKGLVQICLVSALTLVAVMPAKGQAPGDIVAIASGDPDFSTLVTAVVEAGLVEALQGEGPFTVFAPNNAAFEKLLEGLLQELLADTDRLRGILLYPESPTNNWQDVAEEVLTLDGVSKVVLPATGPMRFLRVVED